MVPGQKIIKHIDMFLLITLLGFVFVSVGAVIFFPNIIIGYSILISSIAYISWLIGLKLGFGFGLLMLGINLLVYAYLLFRDLLVKEVAIFDQACNRFSDQIEREKTNGQER